MEEKYHTAQFSCDSVEFNPRNSNIFVCASYFLNPETRKKHGAVDLHKIANNRDDFSCIQSLDIGAVLDSKWCPNVINGKDILGVVLSEGNLELLSFHQEKLESLCSIELENCTALSLDWSSRISASSSPSLIVSMSNGDLVLSSLKESTISITNKWKAHEYEAWICAFDYYAPNIVYSGGDDCLLKGWDSRSYSATFSLQYEMGVTSIQMNPHKENILAVGSYNDKLTLYDKRKIKTPLLEQELGGGVWRIKHHPLYSNLIATACMRTGFKILQISDSENKCEIVESFRTSCETLAYGIDWAPDNSNTLATCSFYDKRCQLWTPVIKSL